MEKKIKDSFIKLLKEYKYNDISIRNITDGANISRRSFYQYYENKLQLYEEIVGDYIEWSLRPFERNDDNQLFSSKISQFTDTILNSIDTVELIFNNDLDILVETIKKILVIQISNNNNNGFFINKLSNVASQQYYINVISLNCVESIKYILNNKTLDKEDLATGLCDACDAISFFYNTKH